MAFDWEVYQAYLKRFKDENADLESTHYKNFAMAYRLAIPVGGSAEQQQQSSAQLDYLMGGDYDTSSTRSGAPSIIPDILGALGGGSSKPSSPLILGGAAIGIIGLAALLVYATRGR